MAVLNTQIHITTSAQFEVINLTDHVVQAVSRSGVKTGLVSVSTPHTTAGIKLNHFEPMLLQDILRMLYRLVPQDVSYSHDLFELRQNVAANERSNGHAHLKALLLGASESLPVESARVALGDRQSILLIECDGGRKRTVNITIIGE